MGRPGEIPGVFSQGETSVAREENIEDTYRLMIGQASGIDRLYDMESGPRDRRVVLGK